MLHSHPLTPPPAPSSYPSMVSSASKNSKMATSLKPNSSHQNQPLKSNNEVRAYTYSYVHVKGHLAGTKATWDGKTMKCYICWKRGWPQWWDWAALLNHPSPPTGPHPPSSFALPHAALLPGSFPFFNAPTNQSTIPALGGSSWGAFNVSAHVRSAISLCKYTCREQTGGVFMPNVCLHRLRLDFCFSL